MSEHDQASHKWDKSGERCEICGDKDWMGGPCRAKHAQDEAADRAHQQWVLNDCRTNGREIYEIQVDIWKQAFKEGYRAGQASKDTHGHDLDDIKAQALGLLSEKLGLDCSCCYDAQDVERLIKSGFDELREEIAQFKRNELSLVKDRQESWNREIAKDKQLAAEKLKSQKLVDSLNQLRLHFSGDSENAVEYINETLAAYNANNESGNE